MSTKPMMKRISFDALFVDSRFQRSLSDRMLKMITKDYDVHLCSALEVSDREDGTYSVLDGQHRLEGLKILGETGWNCRVHTGLTFEQEAELFVRFQMQRRSVSPLDRHKALLAAKDDLATNVERVVNEAGYSISKNHNIGALRAVMMLYQSHTVYGPEALKEALELIDKAWGRDDVQACKAPMVRGMTLLLAKHGESIDRNRLVATLSKTSAARIISRAAAGYELGSDSDGNSWMRVARQLIAIYNKGSRAKLAPESLERAA